VRTDAQACSGVADGVSQLVVSIPEDLIEAIAQGGGDCA
jgi:hypothetical protein